MSTMSTVVATEGPDAVSGPSPAGGPGIPFRRLYRVERRKLVDTRAGRWLLGVMAGLALAAVVAFLVWGEGADTTYMGLVGIATIPMGVLLPILGILTATTEWSQRTGLVTFALEPRRGRVVLAKLAAVTRLALHALVLTVVGVALTYLAGTLVTDVPAEWTYDTLVVGGIFLSLVIYLVQGLAFGFLFLNTPAAIVASMLLPTVFTISTSIVSAVDRVTPWLDLLLATAPLAAGTMTGTDWAHLGTASAVWIGLPLALGTWRVLTKEIA